MTTSSGELLLVRNLPSAYTAGTVGRLAQFNLFTLELPWLDNRKAVSCIPTGNFRMWWGPSKRFGNDRWHVEVPGRSGILLHRGMFLSHTEGCVLVGTGIAVTHRKGRAEYMLLGADMAYPKLLAALAGRRWELKVVQGDQ